jgi:phosphatidylglycerophosphate synthase
MMFDARLRRAYAPMVESAARSLHSVGITAMAVTGAGLVLGLAAAGFAAAGLWWAAIGSWLTSRVVDGLDGAVARIEGATPRGGFVDLIADFTVYAAFVAGLAIALPEARLAAVVLLCTYYVSGAAFLAWSSLRPEAGPVRGDAGLEIVDDRSVRFTGGLAEGFETIVAYSIVCLVPDRAELVLWVFAVLVAITALQRIGFAYSDLGRPGPA